MARTDIALWRIAKHTMQYSADDMSGGGAKLTGGRWNSKGVPVTYASTSIALATLETLAHLGDNIAIRNIFLVRVSVPAALWNKRKILSLESLDPTWVAEPPGLTTGVIGDAWIKGETEALLLVPSVVIPEEHNVLINPAHPDSTKLRAKVVRQFGYDPRL